MVGRDLGVVGGREGVCGREGPWCCGWSRGSVPGWYGWEGASGGAVGHAMTYGALDFGKLSEFMVGD